MTKFFDAMGKERKPTIPMPMEKTDDDMMWECKCGCIYSKEQESCPLCNSKKRRKSHHHNFTPVKLDENDTLTINHTIDI